MGDQFLQVLFLQFQQPDLLAERLGWIEVRSIQNGLDVLQRKLQLAEQQNAIFKNLIWDYVYTMALKESLILFQINISIPIT